MMFDGRVVARMIFTRFLRLCWPPYWIREWKKAAEETERLTADMRRAIEETRAMTSRNTAAIQQRLRPIPKTDVADAPKPIEFRSSAVATHRAPPDDLPPAA